MELDLRAQIGQRLVGGFPGTEISPEFRRLVKEYKIGNVILFKHNIVDEKQLKELCKEITELISSETGFPPFITIDQEGGAVTRLPEELCNVPGAMAIAATGDLRNAKLAAQITAHELKACGINFNLAPDMDVNNNPDNPVIGVRSYGDKPKQVAEFGCAAIEGFLEEKILTCAKHFPGHGDTAVDSHLGLPVIDKSLEELEDVELIPFRAAIEKKIPAIMSSHILFPQLEPEQVPCTMSRRIITGLLKEKLGFEGLVLSDCMEMDAIKKYYGTAKGVASAMAAGVDLVFVCHTAKLLEEAVKTVTAAIKCGMLSSEEMKRSAQKIICYKKEYLTGETYTFRREEDLKKVQDMYRKTITLVQGEIMPIGDKPFFTGCADFRATLVSSQMENQMSFPAYMEEKLGGYNALTSSNPGKEEIAKICSMAEEASMIAVCTYNGHLNKGQLELVNALAELEKPLAVIALRNPYDLSALPKNAVGIAAWDYSNMTLQVLAELWKDSLKPTGVLPIKL